MVAPRNPTVALVGNPNTGKTTLFNTLAGMNQRVGNYPGVTVETKKGRLRVDGHAIDLIDLPGTYSLAARSPDEMVAVDVILGHRPEEPRPDAVLVIVDASNLERNLYLMTQVMDLGVPIVVALNMIDVARSQGLTIDPDRLSQNLGVPVVPIQANKGIGIDTLRHTLLHTVTSFSEKPQATANLGPSKGPAFPDAFEAEIHQLRDNLDGDFHPVIARRLLLDVGGYTEQLLIDKHGPALAARVQAARERLAKAGCGVPGIEARTRYGWIRQSLADCLQRPRQRHVTWTDRIDHVLTHKVLGTLIFIALMFVVFQSIFAWAEPLMNVIKSGQESLADLVGAVLERGPLRSLMVDGIIGGVGSVLVFLPQIMILFAFIAVLEDCGYMARAAFLMDRLMARAGLNGKSFIPMLSSVACAVPGIMSARVIENQRDRLATIIVAPLMSCAARLPVYMLLIAAFLSPEHGFAWWVPGLTLFGLYCLGLVLAPLVAFLLKRTLLRGETPVFVMEMPLYKIPSLRQVARRSFEAGWMFIMRAGTLILASMIVIWACLYFPDHDDAGRSYEAELARLEKIQEDAKEGIENLPEEAAAEERARLQNQLDAADAQARQLDGAWKRGSYLGRLGKWLEPVVRPLGWDWRIGMAALASFPAREVMVGTLGIIFGQGEGEGDSEDESFQTALREVRRDDDSSRRVFSVPVALSVMVFFALCCQCVSTLVIIRRETNSWRWPLFTFVYMTLLAYLGGILTYQVSSLFFTT